MCHLGHYAEPGIKMAVETDALNLNRRCFFFKYMALNNVLCPNFLVCKMEAMTLTYYGALLRVSDGCT